MSTPAMNDPSQLTVSVAGDPNSSWSTAGFQSFATAEKEKPSGGFNTGTGAPPTPAPAPIKRPKGQWFTGTVLFIFVATASYFVWDAFFRYRALGVVSGRTVGLSTGWDGQLQYLHVAEGDRVKQGQLLATVDNVLLRDELARRLDELRMSQADLTAEVSRLKWQFDVSEDGRRRILSDRDILWGTLLDEQARLEEKTLELERAESLRQQQVMTEQEFDEVRLAQRGQREKVEKLTAALDESRKRGDAAEEVAAQGEDQLRPKLLKIEAMRGEVTRLRERLAEGLLRAPFDGLIIKRHKYPGEQVAAREPVVTVTANDSLQIVLYMTQRSGSLVKPGSSIDVSVDGFPGEVNGRVVRVGQQLEPAPENIQTFYFNGQKLLPVYIEPTPAWRVAGRLPLGAVARLSYWGSIKPPEVAP